MGQPDFDEMVADFAIDAYRVRVLGKLVAEMTADEARAAVCFLAREREDHVKGFDSLADALRDLEERSSRYSIDPAAD
jgi:hypothetical protein